MKDQPLVSIIAANYCAEKYVIETLESIKNQTYKNIELIIIDDCSTDNSVEKINRWLIDYNGNYIFIKNQENIGVCATANKAINISNGKYLCFAPTDDILLPRKLEVQVDILEKSGSDVAFVYSDVYLMQENGEKRYGWFIQEHKRGLIHPPNGYIYEHLLEGNFIPGMSALFKSQIFKSLGSFDKSLSYEDYDMWLRIARNYKIVYSDYPSAKYRMRQGSLVNSIKNWNPDGVKIFCKHLDQPKAIEQLEQIAVMAYQSKDQESLSLLDRDIQSRKIKMALRLAKLKVPTFIGNRILCRIK